MTGSYAIDRRAVLAGAAATLSAAIAGPAASEAVGRRPNIVFFMADDLAAHVLPAYGATLIPTPNIDRLAREGMRFTNAFCTNAICTASRASYLTGTYSHVNGVKTLSDAFDARQGNFPRILQRNGYQTGLFGKWHLGSAQPSRPRGFDYFEVLRQQGEYFDPWFETPTGAVRRRGYVTRIVTDRSLAWLRGRDPRRPFCLMVHQKAPHAPFVPAKARADDFEDLVIPEPSTLRDDYAHRANAAAAARIRIGRDLSRRNLKEPVPVGLTRDEELSWKYRRLMEDYLRCVASLDDSVGRLLRGLDQLGVAERTVFVLTSDQGFFLGDHGWYDKRFMYEQSLRLPLIVRHPRLTPAGRSTDAIALNVDVAPTLLRLAQLPVPDRMQGRSLAPVLAGATPDNWRDAMYYRYWMHDDSLTRVRAHYGVRTKRYKLILYHGKGLGLPGNSTIEYPPEWELFDLATDPNELHSVHDDPGYADTRHSLERQLALLQSRYGDTPVEI